VWSDAPSDGRSCGSEHRDTAFLPCGIADAGPAGLKREMKEVKNVFGLPKLRNSLSQNLHFFGSPDGYSVRSTFEGVIGSPFSAIGCRARSTIPSCDSGSVVFGKFRATCQKICEAYKPATGLPARMIAELF
jgi:hypothetical protein